MRNDRLAIVGADLRHGGQPARRPDLDGAGAAHGPRARKLRVGGRSRRGYGCPGRRDRRRAEDALRVKLRRGTYY
jgi:hypothetical protein